jgi:signal transduction histidine kinase
VPGSARRVAVLVAPLALAAGALAARRLPRRALRPVEGVRRDIAAIAVDGLHERIAVPSAPDELRRLAVTVNALLDRVEQRVDRERQRTADALHELRAPLATIRTELDVSLHGDDLGPAAREVLLSARQEVDTLTRVADDVLTLAALDEGRIELKLAPVALLEAVEAAARPFRRRASAERLTLEVGGEPCQARADRERLHQALTNLFDNAVKFTPPGGAVRATVWSAGADVGVTVADTGPGIGADARGRVFDRFYRGDGALGGSGLGLAICREIAAAHGGRVWVESEAGRGSTFSLALPRSVGAGG